MLPGVKVIAVPPECVGLLAEPCRPPAPKALPKRKVAKNKAVAKPAAKSKQKVGKTQVMKRKGSAKAKPSAKKRPAKATKQCEKDLAEQRCKRRKQMTQEQRDRLKRKSCAYHASKRKTLANGGSLEEALASGRAVLWTACCD